MRLKADVSAVIGKCGHSFHMVRKDCNQVNGSADFITALPSHMDPARIFKRAVSHVPAK